MIKKRTTHQCLTLMSAALSLCFFAPVLVADSVTSYLCVADKATGFSRKSGGDWEATEFKADEKYLVKRPSKDNLLDGDDEKNVWIVTKVGTDFPLYGCGSDFSDAGSLVCDGFGEFFVNRKTLRFQAYYPIGYVVERAGNTPYLTIGKCSKL
jgi:hypothetical protein